MGERLDEKMENGWKNEEQIEWWIDENREGLMDIWMAGSDREVSG